MKKPYLEVVSQERAISSNKNVIVKYGMNKFIEWER
jgi:hypothetical protein